VELKPQNRLGGFYFMGYYLYILKLEIIDKYYTGVSTILKKDW